MELPHAAEIRVLRVAADRGTRARTDLADVESVLTSLGLGSAGDRPAALVARLRSSWPDLGLDGEDFAALSKARLALRQILVEGQKAQREMQDLIEHQWSHLKDPEWNEIREEINGLADKRAAIYGSLSPIATQVNALAPMARNLASQVQAIREDAAKGGPHQRKARVRIASLSSVVGTTLASLGTDAGLPAPPGPGNPDLDAAIDEFVGFVGALEDVVARLQADNDELAAELDAVVQKIQAYTG